MSAVDLRTLRAAVKQGRITLEEFMRARAELQGKKNLVTKSAVAPRKATNAAGLVGVALHRARALEAKVDVAEREARLRIAEIAKAEVRQMLRNSDE